MIARPLLTELSATIYHLTVRGNGRQGADIKDDNWHWPIAETWHLTVEFSLGLINLILATQTLFPEEYRRDLLVPDMITGFDSAFNRRDSSNIQ